MGKLLLFGGTFNPIHIGHLRSAKYFMKKIGADRTILIPTKMPVHKSSAQVASAFHRVNMCRLAFEVLPHFEFREIDTKREG